MDSELISESFGHSLEDFGNEDEQGTEPIGFSHFSTWRRLWEYLMLLDGFFIFIELSFIAVFYMHINIAQYSFFFTVDLVFIIDFFIFYRTEVFEDNAWISRPSDIKKYWGNKNFILMIIYSIPLSWIGIVANQPIAYFVLSINKLLRAKRGYIAIKTIRHNFPYSGGTISIIPLLLLFIYVCHIMSTAFVLVSKYEGFENSMFAKYHFNGFELQHYYIVSLYYVVATVTTIGYGDISPKSKPEIILAVLLQFIGNSFTMSVVTIIYAIHADPIKRQYTTHMKTMSEFFEFKRIRKHIRHEAYNYGQQQWNETRGVGYMRQIMKLVPKTFKNVVKLDLTRQFFNKSNIFGGFRNAELTYIAKTLKFKMYSPGDILVQENHHADRIILVHSGQISLVVNGQEMETQFAESFIYGEYGMLFNQPYQASVKAITHVEAWIFLKEDLLKLLADHELLRIAFGVSLKKSYPTDFPNVIGTLVPPGVYQQTLDTVNNFVHNDIEELSMSN